MEAIYKYRLPFMETSHVVMPQHSDIIRIDGLDGAIWMWAIVNTDLPLVRREFKLYKTGGAMPNDIHEYVYLGCGAIFVQMELMMYVFEKPNTEVLVGEEPEPFDWTKHQE